VAHLEGLPPATQAEDARLAAQAADLRPAVQLRAALKASDRQRVVQARVLRPVVQGEDLGAAVRVESTSGQRTSRPFDRS